MQNPRRQRFITYFDARFKGNRQVLIRKTGFTKGRVAQLFDATKPFGEVAGRNLADRPLGRWRGATW